MIRIGICDDDARVRQQIRRVCCETVERGGEQATFILFRGGREVLSYPDSLDILILDIEMPEMSGIEVKKRLERIRNHTLILYVTGHVEFMQEAFGTYVFGFVDKQYLEDLDLKIEDISMLHTGNGIVDCVVNGIAGELKQAGKIDFRIIGRFPNRMKILGSDLCVLFGNVVMISG